MFDHLLQAYKQHDIDIHLGNSKIMCSAPSRAGVEFQAGGGICIADIAFFMGLSRVFTPTRIFCIGNATGYGTFCLAEIFDCPIDVIDAEKEGKDNQRFSEITCQISREHYGNRVSLHTGYSPQDLLACIGSNQYDLVFIDGDHTIEQQRLDFDGMQPFTKSEVVFYLHDVDISGMTSGYKDIVAANAEYKGYNVDFSPFGCKAVIRGLPDVNRWLSFIDHSPVAHLQHPKPYFVVCQEHSR